MHNTEFNTDYNNDLPSSIPLGKTVSSPEKYNPDLLVPIKRQKIITDTYYGIDLWNLYELFWLNDLTIPQTGWAQLSYSCNSEYIIESKSLKLYLNSLNGSIFESESKLFQTITTDLENVLKTKIDIKMITDTGAQMPVKNLITLNTNLAKPQQFKKLIFTQTKGSETIIFHGYRSLCPVTSQPDFASIIIDYDGLIIQQQSLLNLFESHRNKQSFHEVCIDQLFLELSNYHEITNVTVQGAFLRRGGIDITPIRSTEKNYAIFPRQIRQ
jgi:7-cyano-7-deazaguanine reductase